MSAAAPPANSAERVLMDGRVDEAVQMLQAEIAGNGNDGQAHLLLCRAFFSELQIDLAVGECERAVQLLPKSSAAQDWLGRAYGIKADREGPMTGLKLAHKVRDAFAAAVADDPKSDAAADDLAEYYIGAPAIVGGGVDKAMALAARIEASLPQMARRIRGMAAEHNKDYGTAEREFKEEVGVHDSYEAWVDLGGYYTRRKETARAVEALRHGIAADRTRDASSVDAASYLIDLRAEPALAMKTLQQYLADGSKSDAAPVVHVHMLLGKLLLDSGDRAGAKIEWNKALALAANYAPAKRALAGR